MKIVHESLFFSTLRALLVTFFGCIGILAALCLLFIGIAALSSSTDDEVVSYSSKVTILPDADGNRKKLGKSTPVILQINLDSEIGKGDLTGKKIEEILLDSREDNFKGNRVKAILLSINSPGGAVIDSHQIYTSLKNYTQKYQTPIFAYVDGLCASGGYYIACAANQIFCSDVSLIGSIGVVGWPPYPNLYKTLEKIGASALTLSAGKGKDDMNPFRPWKENEAENRQQLIDYYYNQFVDLVTQNRPQISRETLINTYGAHIFPAPLATTNGLVDGSGYTRSMALKKLADLLQLKEYQVVNIETTTWWKKLVKEKARSPLFTGTIKHELALPSSGPYPFDYLYTS